MASSLIRIADKMIREGQGDDVERAMLLLGAQPCVARELHNERTRRLKRAQRRVDKLNSRLKPCKKRGRVNRRVIFSEIRHGRMWQYHATKGWRSRCLDP